MPPAAVKAAKKTVAVAKTGRPAKAGGGAAKMPAVKAPVTKVAPVKTRAPKTPAVKVPAAVKATRPPAKKRPGR